MQSAVQRVRRPYLGEHPRGGVGHLDPILVARDNPAGRVVVAVECAACSRRTVTDSSDRRVSVSSDRSDTASSQRIARRSRSKGRARARARLLERREGREGSGPARKIASESWKGGPVTGGTSSSEIPMFCSTASLDHERASVQRTARYRRVYGRGTSPMAFEV
eukprot:2317581-Rhodomonas_salina.1